MLDSISFLSSHKPLHPLAMPIVNILPLSQSQSVLSFAFVLMMFSFSCRLLDATIDRLSKQIRGLTNLTLNITSTQPLSAVSRHTAPFYPLPHPLAGAGVAAGAGRIPRCLEPAELLLQLEGSGMYRHEPGLPHGILL